MGLGKYGSLDATRQTPARTDSPHKPTYTRTAHTRTHTTHTRTPHSPGLTSAPDTRHTCRPQALPSPSLDPEREIPPFERVDWGNMVGVRTSFGMLLVGTDGSFALYNADNATILSSSSMPSLDARDNGTVRLQVDQPGAAAGPAQPCLYNGIFQAPYFWDEAEYVWQRGAEGAAVVQLRAVHCSEAARCLSWLLQPRLPPAPPSLPPFLAAAASLPLPPRPGTMTRPRPPPTLCTATPPAFATLITKTRARRRSARRTGTSSRATTRPPIPTASRMQRKTNGGAPRRRRAALPRQSAPAPSPPRLTRCASPLSTRSTPRHSQLRRLQRRRRMHRVAVAGGQRAQAGPRGLQLLAAGRRHGHSPRGRLRVRR